MQGSARRGEDARPVARRFRHRASGGDTGTQFVVCRLPRLGLLGSLLGLPRWLRTLSFAQDFALGARCAWVRTLGPLVMGRDELCDLVCLVWPKLGGGASRFELSAA